MTKGPRARLVAFSLWWGLAGLAGLCPSATATAAERRLALLVGVGQYADAAVPPLEGPAYDVAAVQQSLQAHWGFRAEDIEVLLDAQASRQGILGALARLQSRSAAGDQVFIYFSGHGTSALDRNTNLPLPHTSGAFIPWDLRTNQTAQGMVEQLVVGQRDLQPLLGQLDAGGRRVLVVSDSCYSGQAVRALGPRPDGARLVPRFVPLKALEPPAPRTRTLRPEPPPYPYRQVFYLAAASDSEQAVDISRRDLRSLPTIDNLPHGALTDALLRLLGGQLPADRNRDGAIDHAEAYAAISTFMAQRGYAHTPQALPSAVEDRARLAHAPLFGMQARGGGFATAAAPAGAASATVAAAASAGAAAASAAQVAASASTVAAAPVLAPPPAAPPALRLRLEGAAGSAGAVLPPLPGLALTDAALADFSLRAEGAQWQLRGPAGDLVLQGPLAQVQRRLEAALWLRGLQRQAAARPGFTLELQALPSTRGGSFIEGERFNLALRSQRRAVVLLLAVDPQGGISVLYPYSAGEKAPHDADGLVVTPPLASPIRVTTPFGTDELLALAFEEAPAFWSQLPPRGSLAPGSPLLRALEQALAQPGAAVAQAGLLIRSLPRLLQ